MSFAPVSHSMSKRVCQWCSQQVFDKQKPENCGHFICNKCVLNDRSCQSNCPCCWYLNSEQFIHDNKICAGKLIENKNVSEDDQQFQIDESLCSDIID